MDHVSQADFARLMRVTPKTVSVWKSRGRIVMIDDLVDVEASRQRILKFARSRSKALAGARNLGNTHPELMPDAFPAVDEGNAPACRLNSDCRYAAGVSSGLHDMARSMPRVVVKAASDAGVPDALIAALDAALRPALLRRLEVLMDLWAISPWVAADDDQIDAVAGRDTWANYDWDPHDLDDDDLEAEIVAEVLP